MTNCYRAPVATLLVPPETVLVAGASGLVGEAAVRALAAQGHTVRALVRRQEEGRRLSADHVIPVVADLSSPGNWNAGFEGVTAVVDAIQVRVPGRLTVARARRASDERQRIVSVLLEHIRRQSSPLRAYVALSGLEDYVPTGDDWFDEATPLAREARGYSLLSVHSRALLVGAEKDWGLPLVMLRMGLIYGSSGWFPAFTERIRQRRGTLVGPGTNYASLVAAADVGSAIRSAVERAPTGKEFLVSDDEPLRQVEWQSILAKSLGAPPVRRKVPIWLAGLAVGRVNADTFASSRRARNQRAKDGLGWVPTFPTVREGFPAMLRTAVPPSPR